MLKKLISGIPPRAYAIVTGTALLAGTVLVMDLAVTAAGQEVVAQNKNRADTLYRQLPQAEIVEPYDTNRNGHLESDELTGLLRDYSLQKR